MVLRVPLVLLLLTAACSSASETADESGPLAALPAEQRALLESLSPAVLPVPPPDSVNRFADDPSAAAFGQRLFFDPRFSGQLLDGDNDGSVNALGHKGEAGKVACSGCHVPSSGFSDTRTIRQQISLAAGWGKRRAPSLLDVGQSPVVTWDGRWDSLYAQAIGVLESEVEANSSRLFAAYQVFANHRAEYEAIFGALPPFDDATRFPPLTELQTGCTQLDSIENTCVHAMRGKPGDGAEFDGLNAADQDAVTRVVVNLGKALGAYQRQLTCGTSRFDEWVHGNATALSEEEQRGALLFVGKARCVDCHSGPFLSDEKFHNVGLQPKAVATVFLNVDDEGAMLGLTRLQDDSLNSRGSFSDGDDGRLQVVADAQLGAFRTPKLRCVSGRPSFMHTGQMRTLDEVVAFFARGGDSFGFVGVSEISALELTLEERGDLTAFLMALDGPGPQPHLLNAPVD